MKSEKSRSAEFRREFGPKIEKIERRLFLKQSLTLGTVSMLSGCTLKDNDAIVVDGSERRILASLAELSSFPNLLFCQSCTS